MFDDQRVSFAATEVQSAIETLDLSLYALIAGSDASTDIRRATSYLCNDDDAEMVIARAIADGARTLFLVGSCHAGAPVEVDIADAVDITGAPGSVLAGDLSVPGNGENVRLDVPLTGAVTDPHRRVVVPLSVAYTATPVVSDAAAAGVGTEIANMISLTQPEYDALEKPEPSTLYIIRS